MQSQSKLLIEPLQRCDNAWLALKAAPEPIGTISWQQFFHRVAFANRVR